MRDYAAVSALAGAVERQLGPVTALVNNAGTPGPAGLDWEVDPGEWWECVESAVRGAFNCVRAFVPGMIERGAGRVIDIVSVTGTTAWPTVSATSAAKTALIRHAETLAAAGFDRGLRVFALHPGMVPPQLLSATDRIRVCASSSTPHLTRRSRRPRSLAQPWFASLPAISTCARDGSSTLRRVHLNEVSQAEALAGDAVRLRLISSS